MQDRVPLYPGRVTLTPVSGQANTYDMVRADQPTQEGTPLNKANLLKDATAALFGLNETAVPDDALLILSRFQNGMGNEHIWEKYIKAYEQILTAPGNIVVTGYNQSYTIRYSDSINVMTGELEGTINTIYIDYSDAPSKADVLKGKYWRRNGETITYYSDSNATTSGGNYNTLYISKTSKYDGYQMVKTGVISYVNSTDINAYPPPVDDGYTYEYLGKLGEKTRIATGSYVGTDTYGESNPCSLTFDFIPKLVMLVSNRNYGFFISPSREGYSQYSTSIMWHACTWSDHTVSWYTTGGQSSSGTANPNADAQFNSGTIYYLAIG